MHTTHLMRPIFSSSLLSPSAKKEENSRWPTEYPASEANIIFVDPDWKDLEETVMWLREHPKIAKGIAMRQREGMVKRGYLSEAAETCYWRKLFRGYASVSFEPEFFDSRGKWRGLPMESYVLERKLTWNPH